MIERTLTQAFDGGLLVPPVPTTDPLQLPTAPEVVERSCVVTAVSEKLVATSIFRFVPHAFEMFVANVLRSAATHGSPTAAKNSLPPKWPFPSYHWKFARMQ